MADNKEPSEAPGFSWFRTEPQIYKTVDGKVIVEDEFLNFLAVKIRTLAHDEIVLLATNHFDSRWIENSRKVLFDLCPNTKERYVEFQGQQKDANNVKSCLKVLNECGENVPHFVSHFLDELPPVSFNSINVSSLLFKVERLHNEICVLKHAAKSQVEVGEDLRTITSTIDRRVAAIERRMLSPDGKRVPSNTPASARIQRGGSRADPIPAVESEELADDETCDNSSIQQTEKGYRCAMDVPSVLYKYIIGKKGETRRRLEHETKTSINIPKPGIEGQIVITGSQKSAVSSALTRIEVLVESFRKKQPFTHFISIPLNNANVQSGFMEFKDEVLKQCSQDHGVDETIFQNPAKLHLTVGTLTLLNDSEVKKACEYLQDCQDFIREITEGRPVQLEVTGIEYMNDDPAMVDVLYAKVNVKDGTDKLQMIADRLVDHFVSAGLMVREWDRVKLHGTVMNTLFRKDSTVEETGGAGRQPMNEREAFDARNILKIFDAHSFGEFELNTVHLSQRFSSDCTGYYACAGSIEFS